MIWSCGTQRNTLQLQTIDCSSAEHLGRLDKKVVCQNQTKEDHRHHLQPFNKGTKGQPACQQSDSACRGQPHLPGGDFRQAVTWKQQTEKAEARAKVRLALMKKLASTTWGADTVTLKRLCTGRVRPVLGYVMTAWGTTAKSNFEPAKYRTRQPASSHEVNTDCGAGNNHIAPVT